MYLVYNILFPLVYFLLLFASLFSRKLLKNVKIRTSVLNIKSKSHENKSCFWFHAASVGEYELLRPIILELKKNQPKPIIYVSVFSYSAYTQCSNDNIFDFFFVLPFDFPFKMKKLIKYIKPKFICYARYDIWPNMARLANQEGIKQILISAEFSNKSMRNKFPFYKFYMRVYSYLDKIFTIDKLNQKRFNKMGLRAIVAGDTRYNAIQYRLKQGNKWKNSLVKIKTMARNANKKILVAGSTYQASEKFLIDFTRDFFPEVFLILTPHHVDKSHIKDIEFYLEKLSLSYMKYTDWENNKNKTDFSVLIIDITGILLYLYTIADFCYVGGGFKGSIHSTIEAAFAQVPILTGPYIERSQDALDLKKIGLIHTMKNPDHIEVVSWYKTIKSSKIFTIQSQNKPELLKLSKKKELVSDYILKKSNAVDTIYKNIKQYI